MSFGLYIIGDRGLNVLGELLNKSLSPDFVVSYDDNNTKDTSYFETINICRDETIPFYDKANISEHPEVDKIFVIGWQYLIKGDLSKYIVIHDSWLPEYKGWSPTVNYLIEGSNYLAATAFQPTDKMDTGLVYAQSKARITYPLKIHRAIDIVSGIYVELIEKIIGLGITPEEMTGDENFCMWRNSDDYQIDWLDDADRIKRFIDAVGYPYDGAQFNLDGKTLYVHDAEVILMKVVEQKKHVGKIFQIEDGSPIVICGTNAIKLTNVTDVDDNPHTFKSIKKRL